MGIDWNEPGVTAALTEFYDPVGCRVVEVGCAEGELNAGYANRAAFYVGVDVKRERLLVNRKSRGALPPNVHLAAARAEALPFQHQAFDVALLAWSL